MNYKQFTIRLTLLEDYKEILSGRFKGHGITKDEYHKQSVELSAMLEEHIAINTVHAFNKGLYKPHQC